MKYGGEWCLHTIYDIFCFSLKCCSMFYAISVIRRRFQSQHFLMYLLDVRVAWSLVFCVVFCRSLLTDFDSTFGIFKLFLHDVFSLPFLRRNYLLLRIVWRYQRGNQNPYIEEQTAQWPKEKVQKDKQRSTKHTYKTKDRVTWTPLKTGGELRCSGRVNSSCSTSTWLYPSCSVGFVSLCFRLTVWCFVYHYLLLCRFSIQYYNGCP